MTFWFHQLYILTFADDTSLSRSLCNFFITIPQSNADFDAINRAINDELHKLTTWLQKQA